MGAATKRTGWPPGPVASGSGAQGRGCAPGSSLYLSEPLRRARSPLSPGLPLRLQLLVQGTLGGPLDQRPARVSLSHGHGADTAAHSHLQTLGTWISEVRSCPGLSTLGRTLAPVLGHLVSSTRGAPQSTLSHHACPVSLQPHPRGILALFLFGVRVSWLTFVSC